MFTVYTLASDASATSGFPSCIEVELHVLASAMEPAVEQFMDAAQTGESSKIKSYLSTGVSVNARDRAGFTALHRCCVGGSADAASLLLARGANVNAVDEVRLIDCTRSLPALNSHVFAER